eukprot:jgi/Chlat1/4458/Chrsp29S04411
MATQHPTADTTASMRDTASSLTAQAQDKLTAMKDSAVSAASSLKQQAYSTSGTTSAPAYYPPATPTGRALPPAHQMLGTGATSDLLLWKNPVASGSALGVVAFFYLALQWFNYTLVSLLANLLLIVVVVTFLWSHAAALLKRSPPPLPNFQLSETDMSNLTAKATHYVNLAFAYVHRVGSGKDALLSLKVALGLYIVSIVGGWFNLVDLIFIATILAFTVPKLYEKYDGPINEKAKLLMAKAHELYQVFDEKVLSRIPKQAPQTKKQA